MSKLGAFFESLKFNSLKKTKVPPPFGPPVNDWGVYLGNNRALTKTVFGHKMIVDTRDLSLTPHLLAEGRWEYWITKVFQSEVKPGMKVVDIGANLGYYSVLAAQAIGPKGHLTCFEANPQLADIVFHNLHLNGFVERSTVENKAVFSETTELELQVFQNYLGSSSLWADTAHAQQFHDKLEPVKVEGVSLDDYFPAGTAVDFMKIDAEGAEPHILQGAERLLNDSPSVSILMEFAPPMLRASFGSVEGFYQSLKSKGFEIYEIRPDSSLVPLPLAQAQEIAWTDVMLKR